MKTVQRYSLISLAVTAASIGGGGCSVPSGSGSCVATAFISPTTATLDHTIAGNSQTFTTGFEYPPKCAVPALSVGYTWNVSDTIDASISSALGPTATATCNAAALNPISIYTTVATYPSGSTTPIYVPSGLPSATLICK